MNKHTRMFQLSALATIAAAILSTGMAIQGTQCPSSNNLQAHDPHVTLQADGPVLPPVLPVHPPKTLV
jgi:hypothetical protein